MKSTLFCIILLVNSAFAVTGHEGTGGGGVVRNGQYLTFGSAKVKLRPDTLATVPGLTLLKRFASLSPLPAQEAGKVVVSFLPSAKRRYYQIDAADLDPAKKAELIKEYSEAIDGQIPEQDMVVFAVTSETETYLLPEFFKLDEIQQAAILFHEMLWVLNPDLTYDEVIDAEIRFENYLRTQPVDLGYDADLFAIFDQLFKNNSLSIYAAAADDMKKNRLKPLLIAINGEPFLKMTDVLGEAAQGADEESSWINREELARHLFLMMEKYPDIQFFKALYNRVEEVLEETSLKDAPKWRNEHRNFSRTREDLYLSPWDAKSHLLGRPVGYANGYPCFGAALITLSRSGSMTQVAASSGYAVCVYPTSH